MKAATEQTLRAQLERAAATRANIKKVYIFVVLVLIVVVFSVVKLGQVEFFGRGHFLSPASIINLLRTAVPIMTLSGSFTLLMISGYIDLSVGSAMSLSAVVFALMILNGFPFAAALPITLVLGVAFGALNGLLVVKLRITPVIATLVTLNLFKGIALLIVPDGESAIKSVVGKSMPAWINDYARKNVLLGLPWAFYIAILVIVVLVIVQRKTILGQVRRGDRRQPHRGGAVRHQRRPGRVGPVHHRGLLRRPGRHGPGQLHVPGGPAVGRRHGAGQHHRRAAGRARPSPEERGPWPRRSSAPSSSCA